MSLEEQYRIYIGAYFGTRELDEYQLKSYILKDLEECIRNFILINPIPNFDYQKEAERINESTTLKRKLQDCLLIFPKLNVPMEVILMIKEKIKYLNKE